MCCVILISCHFILSLSFLLEHLLIPYLMVAQLYIVHSQPLFWPYILFSMRLRFCWRGDLAIVLNSLSYKTINEPLTATWHCLNAPSFHRLLPISLWLFHNTADDVFELGYLLNYLWSPKIRLFSSSFFVRLKSHPINYCLAQTMIGTQSCKSSIQIFCCFELVNIDGRSIDPFEVSGSRSARLHSIWIYWL